MEVRMRFERKKMKIFIKTPTAVTTAGGIKKRHLQEQMPFYILFN